MNFLEFSEDIRLFAELLRQSLHEEPVPMPSAAPVPSGTARAGQVWATRTGARKGVPCMVLLLREDGALWEGLLLTDQLWMATEEDLLLPEDAGTIDLPVVCLKLPVRLAPSSLHALLGELHPPYLSAAVQLRTVWSRLSHAEAAEDDPRGALRELLVEATRYLGEEAASWSAARSPAVEEPSRWSSLLQAMKRAFEEVGATLVFPQEALAPVRSAGSTEEALQATLTLGDIVVALDLRLAGEELILQGTASRGDDPVPGVRVELTRTRPGQEPLAVARETDEDGVFFATRLPATGAASYELQVAHGGAQVNLRW